MILERYIHREILEKIGWIIGLLFLILVSNRFVGYLADAAAGTLPAGLILQMLSAKMLATMPRMLPIAVFLAVMLALSRMNRDRELTIMSGSGMSEMFQFMAVSRFTAVFAIFVAIAGFYLAPLGERQVQELKARAKTESDLSGITAGQFREFNEGERVVYIQRISEDRESMEEVFLQVRQQERLGVLASESARYVVDPRSSLRYALFENGRRYVGKPGSLDYQITEYRRYGILLDYTAPASGYEDLESLPTSKLLQSSQPGHRAELQWRLSYIIAALLLPLLGVAMNRFALSEHRYTPVFVAVFVYFIYSNLLGISKTLLKRDQIPAFVGLWWVHACLLLVIVLIVKFPAVLRRFRNPPAAQILPADR
ncbi:MAG: LPS export ABC transporter permease LptF [Gammaproteobacteria bacterium]|nr:LPS export ABC transporter permease LptF [Gammaproteobacteria bacterium]